jgi:hypothetical protein
MKELLRSYRLDSPMPADVQRHISSRIERVFAGVMKKAGIYTPLLAFFSYVYFLMKRFGIIIPLKSFVIVGIIAGLSGGGLIYLYVSKEAVTEGRVVPPTHEADDDPAEVRQESKTYRPAFRLAINPLRSKSIDAGMLHRATMIMSGELSRLRGPEFSAMADAAGNAAYILSGHIEEAEGEFILIVKIVDSRSSAIVYVTRHRMRSPDEIPESCREISAELSRRVR